MYKQLILILYILVFTSSYVYGSERVFQQSRYIPGEGNTENHRRALDADIRSIVQVLQGRVAFGESTDGVDGENIEGEFQVVADTGTADTEFVITHTLDRTPNGYIVTRNTGAGSIYDSNNAHTSTQLKLKSTAANAAVDIFIF